MLFLPLAALAQQQPAQTPQPMPAAQRATEEMVLDLTRIWQRQAIEKEQIKDALRDAQQNAMTKMKEGADKDTEIAKLNAKVKDLEELTGQLQGRLKQGMKEGTAH
jgi:predicted RecB family endonuclease